MSVRETTAPEDVLFKRYRHKYDTIRDKIDYGDLALGGLLVLMYRKAKEVLTLVKQMLEKGTFTRGDYK